MKSILADVCQIFELDNASKLPQVAQTITKCVKMIPSLENFVADICNVLLPDVEYQNVAPHFDVKNSSLYFSSSLI